MRSQKKAQSLRKSYSCNHENVLAVRLKCDRLAGVPPNLVPMALQNQALLLLAGADEAGGDLVGEVGFVDERGRACKVSRGLLSCR